MAGQDHAHKQHTTSEDDVEAPATGTATPAATRDAQDRDAEVDALLDEIDDVLETNAEEFVASFVQKGGQ